MLPHLVCAPFPPSAWVHLNDKTKQQEKNCRKIKNQTFWLTNNYNMDKMNANTSNLFSLLWFSQGENGIGNCDVWKWLNQQIGWLLCVSYLSSLFVVSRTNFLCVCVCYILFICLCMYLCSIFLLVCLFHSCYSHIIPLNSRPRNRTKSEREWKKKYELKNTRYTKSIEIK